MGRNTAPALTLAALAATEAGDDSVLVVMPADHVIAEVAAFRSVVAQGAVYAGSGKLVTFGIRPTHPETGYGYIRVGSALAGGGHEMSAFVEKPDAATAERYVASGEYFWNSGIFMMRASVWLEQLAALRPRWSMPVVRRLRGAAWIAISCGSMPRRLLRVQRIRSITP